MKRVELVLGILAGFTLGAATGILFAPAKGKKMRKRIFRKGRLVVTGAHDQIKSGLKELHEVV